jgi:cellulose biosynthesis protein BcsQ
MLATAERGGHDGAPNNRPSRRGSLVAARWRAVRGRAVGRLRRVRMNFDQLVPYLPVIGGGLTVAATVLGIVYKVYVGRLKRAIRDLKSRLETSQAAVAAQAKELSRLTTDRDHYKGRAGDLDDLKVAHDSLAAAHTAAQEQLREFERDATARGNRVRKALELEGAIWTQPVMAGTCRFRPLADRRMSIVSVLNLKGGVGKTTLTAYLAWASARRGYRILLVDLDLQGSLSSFFVPNLALKRMDGEGRLLRHYLAAATKDRATKLADFAVPVPILNDRSRLVATTDNLAYAELGLTFQWLLRVGRPSHQWNGRRDVRMTLRRALHAKGLTNRFDLVLLDCPPLINLCCANALAASDFVLVPVTPNTKAIERVTPLLHRVLEIRQEGVNPNLNVLGVVTNRTQEKDLTPKEQDLLRDLPQKCYDILKQDVYQFDTHVPQRAYIRDHEDAFEPPTDASVMTVFEALAEEFVKRLPDGCRKPQPARSRRSAGPIGGEE